MTTYLAMGISHRTEIFGQVIICYDCNLFYGFPLAWLIDCSINNEPPRNRDVANRFLVSLAASSNCYPAVRRQHIVNPTNLWNLAKDPTNLKFRGIKGSGLARRKGLEQTAFKTPE